MGRKRIKILFDITHPADVHQFRYIIDTLMKENDVLVVARKNKDSVISLLDDLKIKYVKRRGYNNLLGKIFGLFTINMQLLFLAIKFKADVLVGSTGNCYVAHVSKLLNKPSVVLDDTEHTHLQNKLTFPFANKILTPDSYLLDLGAKQVRYNGTKEMFYLTKENFIPNKIVKDELFKTENVFFLRFSSWDANHDIGKSNTFDKKELVDYLKSYGDVIISAEGDIDDELKKYTIPDQFKKEYHSILFYSSIVITEGASTAAEAAVLGTPTVYTNPLSLGYIEKLKSEGRIICALNMHELKDGINGFLKHEGMGKKDILESEYDLNNFVIEEIYKVVHSMDR